MNFWEIAKEVYNRKYHSGDSYASPYEVITYTAEEILEGFYYGKAPDLEEAGYHLADMRKRGQVGFTMMGHEYDANALELAISVMGEGMDNNTDVNLSLANELAKQHPNCYDVGLLTWFDAEDPISSDPLRIKRTFGRGRVQGEPYLHVKRRVERVLIERGANEDGSDRETHNGYAYFHVRFNLRTGEAKVL